MPSNNTWDYNSMSAKRKMAYRKAAEKAEVTVESFLNNAKAGFRFCRICRLWKNIAAFHVLPTPTSITGNCKSCKSTARGYTRPEGLAPRFWGPYVKAAKLLNITPQQYYDHRQAGQHHCIGCKGWFKAHEEATMGTIRDQYCNKCRGSQNDHGKGKQAVFGVVL